MFSLARPVEHKFPKTLRATSKSQVPEGRDEGPRSENPQIRSATVQDMFTPG